MSASVAAKTLRFTWIAVCGGVLAVAAGAVTPAPARAADGPLDRAADLARAGRCADALPLLDAIPAADPASGSALYLKARCLEELGRRAEAAALYEALAARLPESAPAVSELKARAAELRAPPAAAAALPSASATATAPAGPAGASGVAASASASVEDTERPPPPPTHELREGYHPATVAGYLVGAAGGVAVVTGVLLGVIARSHARELEDLALNGSPDPMMPGVPLLWDESLAHLEREGRLFARLAVGLLVGGGALVLTGAAVGVFGVPRAPASSLDHEPAVGVVPVPGGAVVTLGLVPARRVR